MHTEDGKKVRGLKVVHTNDTSGIIVKQRPGDGKFSRMHQVTPGFTIHDTFSDAVEGKNSSFSWGHRKVNGA